MISLRLLLLNKDLKINQHMSIKLSNLRQTCNNLIPIEISDPVLVLLPCVTYEQREAVDLGPELAYFNELFNYFLDNLKHNTHKELQ